MATSKRKKYTATHREQLIVYQLIGYQVKNQSYHYQGREVRDYHCAVDWGRNGSPFSARYCISTPQRSNR